MVKWSNNGMTVCRLVGSALTKKGKVVGPDRGPASKLRPSRVTKNAYVISFFMCTTCSSLSYNC